MFLFDEITTSTAKLTLYRYGGAAGMFTHAEPPTASDIRYEKAASSLHKWPEENGFWLERAMARLTPEFRKSFRVSYDRLDALDFAQRDWRVQVLRLFSEVPFVLPSLRREDSGDDDEAAIFSMICVIHLNLRLVTVNCGGTKTYNPGAREFRATYVSLLLFRGSYVWIKFRNVARRNSDHNGRKGYVYVRTRDDKSGTPYLKYEPRYTPPGKKNPLRLGEYYAEHDAEVVLQFAKFQYNEDALVLDLGEGFRYPKSEQERNLSAQDKWAWIPDKAKEVVKEYHAWRARVAGGRRELVDGAASSEDVGATRPEQVGAENLTCDIMADEFLNPFHDISVDNMNMRDRWVDDMIVQGGAPPTEDRENEQPNLQNEQLEEEHQLQPRQIQPSLEQPTFHWLENSDLRDKNDVLKSMYEHVRKRRGLPSLPLRSEGENFTQQPLEVQNSELSLENQRLKSILESVLSQL